MIFTQLTNVSAGTIYTSADPAVGTIVASLTQAKHRRDKHVHAIFSLFFGKCGEYCVKMKQSSSSIVLKHVIIYFLLLKENTVNINA